MSQQEQAMEIQMQAESSASEITQVNIDIKSVNQQIEDTIVEMGKVKEGISKLEKKGDHLSASDQRKLDRLTKEGEHLWNEKEQLRKKKEQLRKKKEQLRKKEEQLRELQLIEQKKELLDRSNEPSAKRLKQVLMSQQERAMEVQMQAESSASEITQVNIDIQSVNQQIEDVKVEMGKVKEEISKLEEKGDHLSASDQRKLDRLRKEKEHLWNREEHLRKKKEWLRKEEEQLRELQLKLLDRSAISSRQKVLTQQVREIGAPSSFAKAHNWIRVQRHLDVNSISLMCHRPADTYGDDVSLFYREFDTFVSDCKSESLPLDKEDTMFAVEFTMAMSDYCSDEDGRKEIIKEKLGEYLLGKGKTLHSIDNTNFAVSFGNGFGLIGEVRNEVGQGGCDSYLEVIANYIKAVERMATKNVCVEPCFLMEIIGMHMAIYGAVYTNTACFDRLTPCLWLAFQPNNRLAMKQLMRTLKALKVALGGLNHYYTSLPSSNLPSAQVEFPCFRTFKDETSQQQTEITYTAKRKNHVFHAKTNTDKKVIVKFVEKYGSDAHKACAMNGLAPKLLSDMQVTSRFKMVVMEYLEDATELNHYFSSNPSSKERLLKHCREALDKLHESGFCHGDFRPNNILVVNNGECEDIRIIDFDWSGRTDEETYPLFMNHVNLKWHPTASDGKVLRKEHDLYWLDRF